MISYHIGVASRDHVKLAEAGGFCQLCHGQGAPLRRLSPGDGVIYYSPKEAMRSGRAVQCFTAIGWVEGDNARRAAPSKGFHPWRRQIRYLPAREVPIADLMGQLSFTRQGTNWGWLMRRGLFEVTAEDFQIIAGAMAAPGEPAQLTLPLRPAGSLQALPQSGDPAAHRSC